MAGTAFNSANWTGYDEQSWTNPDSDLSEFTGIIDISNLSASFGSNVQSDGADIRITKGDDTELAYDLIDWDYNSGSPTGLIRFLWSGTLSSSGAQNVRVWAGYAGGTATAYSANETYGSDNAYDSNWEGYWPLSSDFNDRTSNGNNLTTAGSISAGGVTGLLGDATEFDGTDDRAYAQNVASMSSSTEHTVISSWYADTFDPISSFSHFILELSDDYTNTTDSIRLTCGEVDSVNVVTVSTDGGNTGDTSSDTHGVSWSTATWYQSAVVWDQPNTHLQWYNDGTSIYNNTSYSDTSSASDIVMGSNSVPDRWFDGRQQHLQIHSTARSADWISLEYDQTNDNATFWGTWTWNSTGGGGISIPVVMHHRRLIGAA